MKRIVIFVAVLAVAMCAPNVDSNAAALRALPALQHEVERDELGQYAFRYITAEGTVISEHGYLVSSEDSKERIFVVEGEVSYIGDDGKTYITKYKAGPDGNRVQGDHLPTQPQPVEIEN